MFHAELTQYASLVFCLHAPSRGTIAECLTRWASFDAATQANSYLVIEGAEPGARHTIGAAAIAVWLIDAEDAYNCSIEAEMIMPNALL